MSLIIIIIISISIIIVFIINIKAGMRWPNRRPRDR